MDLDSFHQQVKKGAILSAERDIHEREQQIRSLTLLNNEAHEKVQSLREAAKAVETALLKLGDIGGLSLSESMSKKKRVSVKSHVIPMLVTAGTSGVTSKEIMAHYKETTGLDIVRGSLYAFLSANKKLGVIEKQASGCWRLTQKNNSIDPTIDNGLRSNAFG